MESNSKCMDCSSTTEDTHNTAIPIYITAKLRKKTKLRTDSPSNRLKFTNSKQRYHIYCQQYKTKIIVVQQEFQRMINDTLDILKQRHWVPSVARPIILNIDKTVRVNKTIGQYIPQRERFTWQQKIVSDASRAYQQSIRIHKYVTKIKRNQEDNQYFARAKQSAGLPSCPNNHARVPCTHCLPTPAMHNSSLYIVNV